MEDLFAENLPVSFFGRLLSRSSSLGFPSDTRLGRTPAGPAHWAEVGEL